MVKIYIFLHFLVITLNALTLQDCLVLYEKNSSEAENKEINDIYKKYILNSKINYDKYLYNLNKDNKNINFDERTETEVLIQKYLLALKYQELDKILSNDIKLYDHKIVGTNEEYLKKKKNLKKYKILHLNSKKELFSYINHNSTNEIIKIPNLDFNIIPETFEKLLQLSIVKNTNIKSKIFDIKESWRSKNMSDPTFLPQFDIYLDNSKSSNKINSESELNEYINNKWQITYSKSNITINESIFLKQNLQSLRDLSKEVTLKLKSLYTKYQNEYKDIKVLNELLDNNKSKFRENNLEILKKNFQLKQDILNKRVSLYNHYYDLINQIFDLKRVILNNTKIISNKYQSSIYNKFLNSPPSYYTINLATYASFRRANLFIKKAQIKNKAIAYSIDYNNDIVKVIFGVYKNRIDASNEILNFSEDLKVHKPFIERIRKHQILYNKYNDIE